MKILKNIFLSTILIVFAVSIFCFSNTNIVYADTKYSNYDQFSITLLHPYIEKAIEKYYGYNRRYEIGDSYLEILERRGNVFTVKVKVDTFEGAHNNYYTEILIFTVTPASITLEDYSHSDFYK